jgi:archaellum component FlaF (FlaF/FlaG flagellin family)
MGFGNIISQVILFMSIMITLVVVSLIFKSYVTNTNLSLQIQHENIVQKLETSFSILNVTYDETNEEVNIFLKNTGSRKLDPSEIDLFILNDRLSRNNFDIEILESTNLINHLHWDPGEILIIKVSYIVTENSLFRISAQKGIVRSYILEA